SVLLSGSRSSASAPRCCLLFPCAPAGRSLHRGKRIVRAQLSCCLLTEPVLQQQGYRGHEGRIGSVCRLPRYKARSPVMDVKERLESRQAEAKSATRPPRSKAADRPAAARNDARGPADEF